MKRKKSNQVLLNVSATLIVTIISIAVTIFSLKSDSQLVKFVYIMLLICLCGLVVAIYIYLAGIDFKENKEQYEKSVQDIELLATLPCLFVFESRKDIFTVFDNGDAELEWNFEIEKKTESKISFINFPVVCERMDNNASMDFSSVKVKELNINGEKQHNAVYELKSINYSKENKRALEQGCIHVPLYSKAKKGEIIHIKIVLLFKDIFHEFRTGEFVVVDIPYITKNLKLIIKPQSDKNHIDVIDNFFNVHEVNGQNTDVEEQVEQTKNCLTKNNTLEWETQYPKLGYRYELSFKFIEGMEV